MLVRRRGGKRFPSRALSTSLSELWSQLKSRFGDSSLAQAYAATAIHSSLTPYGRRSPRGGTRPHGGAQPGLAKLRSAWIAGGGAWRVDFVVVCCSLFEQGRSKRKLLVLSFLSWKRSSAGLRGKQREGGAQATWIGENSDEGERCMLQLFALQIGGGSIEKERSRAGLEIADWRRPALLASILRTDKRTDEIVP